MNPNTFIRLTVSVGVLSVAAYACSSDPDLSGFGRGLGTGGAAGLAGTTAAGASSLGVGGSSASGGSGGSGGGAVGGSGGTIVVSDASVPDAMLEPDAACATGTADASLRPVNMLVMFDRSGSMLEVADETTSATRWDLTSAALTQFFQDPGAADLGVALRFFPHDLPAAGCTKQACDVSACSQVLVDMGKLTADSAPMDVQEESLVTAVGTSAPVQGGGMGMQSGGTPISAALDGALTWATTYQAAHPEEQTVVIFVTDGQPNGCDESFGTISAIAADALASAGVATYAIGLQNADGTAISPDDMNRLAAAGGTDKAFFVSDGPTASADLLAALNAIRGMAIACDFPMPTTTSSGMVIDKNLVNVTFTPSGAMPSDFTKVASAADCLTSLSWYYDNEDAPTRIVLCPSACETATADPGASIKIIVGCAPNIEPPR